MLTVCRIGVGVIGVSASIIQGSAAGPASYVVTGPDLRPVTNGNSMVKFADDTYLIIPASNSISCEDEINHVGDWASSNNLRMNHAKSMEIVFVPPRSRRAIAIPEPAVPDIPRVESLKTLRVTLSRKFSLTISSSLVRSHCLLCTLFDIMACRQTHYN